MIMLNPKAAQGIARNIRIIAVEAAEMAASNPDEWQRAEYDVRITKAEDNIAQWLQQPLLDDGNPPF